MKKETFERFCNLRKRVAKAIHEELIEAPCHKSYEGTWEITVGYPDYFDDDTATAGPDFYRIVLHCYVLGPGRHYNWDGRTFEQALDACEKAVNSWIEGDDE